MSKLYTKRGDAGQTDLFTGQRVFKDALRVDAYGTVDELNSILGWCAAACEADDEAGRALIHETQSRLFEMGSDLATPTDSSEAGDRPQRAVPRLGQAQIDEMEGHIDEISAKLPPMKHFVLPGGSELAARLHVARTVCRRAERLCVALSHHATVGEGVIVYLNRLSDLLFALARQANHRAGVADIPWQGSGEADEQG